MPLIFPNGRWRLFRVSRSGHPAAGHPAAPCAHSKTSSPCSPAAGSADQARCTSTAPAGPSALLTRAGPVAARRGLLSSSGRAVAPTGSRSAGLRAPMTAARSDPSIVSRSSSRTTPATDGVDLVDEDDGQAAQGEAWYAGLTGDSPGQQGLAGPRWPDHGGGTGLLAGWTGFSDEPGRAEVARCTELTNAIPCCVLGLVIAGQHRHQGRGGNSGTHMQLRRIAPSAVARQ
jgi:hypothetical protein